MYSTDNTVHHCYVGRRGPLRSQIVKKWAIKTNGCFSLARKDRLKTATWDQISPTLNPGSAVVGKSITKLHPLCYGTLTWIDSLYLLWGLASKSEHTEISKTHFLPPIIKEYWVEISALNLVYRKKWQKSNLLPWYFLKMTLSEFWSLPWQLRSKSKFHLCNLRSACSGIYATLRPQGPSFTGFEESCLFA